MDHPWLMAVLGGPSINYLLRPWNQSKMVKMSESTSTFYLGVSTNEHMITVGSYVQFHSEKFSAKPKEFIGCQTDHRWWDLGSPGGFMGRIWRPGDHISAALLRNQCVFFFSVHDFLSVPLLFAASSQCPILCSGCQGEWFGSRERCDYCQGSGGSLHCGERHVEGQSLTPLTHPQWPPNSQTIFSNVFLWIKKIKISLKFVPKGPLDNNPALVHVMAWRRIGDKPLSEPMLTSITEAYTQR